MGDQMGLRVLVVDDEIVMRRLLKLMLEHLNCMVLLAPNFEDGFEILLRHPIDVIIYDLKMPSLPELDCLQHIRTDPHLRLLPVIVVTSAGLENGIPSTLKEGTMAVLPKPFTSRQLETRLHTVVQASLMNA